MFGSKRFWTKTIMSQKAFCGKENNVQKDVGLKLFCIKEIYSKMICVQIMCVPK